MGSKSASKPKRYSLSPEVYDSSFSEASSSRSAMEVEEATTVDNSDDEQASDLGSGADANDSDGDADSVSDSEDGTTQRPTIDKAKARTKLHHVAKTLRATAKKSKTFEVQKLVKKLKGLQKKASLADQATLTEQELAALKSIDTSLLAGRALITKMVKAKLLPRPAGDADDEEYIYLQMVKDEELLGDAVLRDPVLADGDKALERAKAKITSSKVLADQVGKFVDELKKLAGIEPAASRKQVPEVDVKGKGKANQVEEDEEEREWSGSEEEDDSEDDEPRRLPMADNDDDDSEEEDGDEEELMRRGREKMKALGDLSQWDDMIGSDSGADSGLEDEEPTKRKRKSRDDSDSSSDDASSDDDSDISDSESDSNSDSDSDSSAPSSSRPRKRKATSTSSTFLPSLSTGFIAGRSDDEWSDAEADLADRDLSELKSGKKERKNRMGQRARKAFYEKKYGSNANHLKLREERKRARLERAPPANGGGGGRQRPPAFQAPAKKDGGWGGPVAPLPKQPKRVFRAPPEASQVGGVPKTTSAPTPAPAATAKSQAMHPSWIAKQKQKELMAQVKPQGKKVVFD